MGAGKLNVTVEQGATFVLRLQLFEDDATTPIDLTGYTVRAHVRRTHSQPDPPILDLSTTSGQIVLTDAANGTLEIRLTAVQTAALSAPFAGVWDLETVSGSIVERWVEGTWCHSPEVTR